MRRDDAQAHDPRRGSCLPYGDLSAELQPLRGVIEGKKPIWQVLRTADVKQRCKSCGRSVKLYLPYVLGHF
jgi:hypothetical protein